MRALSLVALLAVVAVLGSRAAARTGAGGPLAVLGFQSEGSPAKLIDRSADSVTLVGVDGVDLTGPGEVSAPDAPARRQLARAHADGLPAELLVGNWSDRVNDFYEPLAYRTLGNASRAAGGAAGRKLV